MKKKLAIVLTLIVLVVGGKFGFDYYEDYDTEDPQQNLVIILALTANSALPTSDTLEEKIEEVVLSGGNITVIIPDGTTSIDGSFDLDGISKKLSANSRDILCEEQLSSILYEIYSLEADSQESDLNAAFMLAQRVSSTFDEDEECNLYIVHNGISTTGYVDTINMHWSGTSIESQLDFLETYLLLADFSNFESIQWLYFGDVSSPQESLTEVFKAELKEFWTAYIEVSNSNLSFSSEIPSTSTLSEFRELPYVSTIYEGDIFASGPVSFDGNSDVAFQSNSTAFLCSDDEVLAALSEIIAYLNEDDNNIVLLVGMTASWGDSQGSIELSADRAEAVKSLILANESNINDSQIITTGIGFEENDYRCIDIDESTGELIESEAIKNRSILIFDANGDAATEFLP